MKKDEKLVRDFIPRIIEEEGGACSYRHAADTHEHVHMLILKMSEELEEFCDNPSYEEAADLLEVVKGLCAVHGLSFEEVISAAIEKWGLYGGFDHGIILEATSESR